MLVQVIHKEINLWLLYPCFVTDGERERPTMPPIVGALLSGFFQILNALPQDSTTPGSPVTLGFEGDITLLIVVIFS